MIERLATVLPAATVEVPPAPAERLVARSEGGLHMVSHLPRTGDDPSLLADRGRHAVAQVPADADQARGARNPAGGRRDFPRWANARGEARRAVWPALAGRRVTMMQGRPDGHVPLGPSTLLSRPRPAPRGPRSYRLWRLCETSDTALAPFAERDGITVWAPSAARGETGAVVEHIAFSPER